MSNYRRTSNKSKQNTSKGIYCLSKTIATIGSILGLITATITIMNAMDNNKNNKKNRRQLKQLLSRKFKGSPSGKYYS